MLPFIILVRDQFFFSTIAVNFLWGSFGVEFGIVGQPGFIDRIYHLLTIQSGVFQNFYAVATILFALLFYLISKAVTGNVNIKDLAAKNQNLVYLLIFIGLYETFCLAAPLSTVSLRVFTFSVTAIVAGVGLSRVLAAVKDKNAALLLYGLIIGLIILTPFTQYAQGNEARPTLTWQKTEMNYILSVADKVAGYTENGDRILTFTPAFAIQANRELMPGTVMELYAFFPTWETERAMKYNLLNSAMLLDYLSSREPEAVVLTEDRFFSGEVMGRVLDAYRPEIMAALEENYYLVEKLSYPSETGRGDVYIYLPRTK